MPPDFNDILQAAKDNAVDDMKRLLSIADGSAVSMCNCHRSTGLHIASVWGSLETAALLLSANADVNAQDIAGVTPLHRAAEGSHHELAQLLVDSGADIHISMNNGMKAYQMHHLTNRMRNICGRPSMKLHNAILAADHEALVKLVTHESATAGVLHPLRTQDTDGNSPLHLAVSTALGDHLEEATIFEFDQDEAAWTELTCSRERCTSLHLLLRHGASASSADLAAAQRLHNQDGNLPLHLAAARGNTSVCRALLLADAPVNGRTLHRGGYYSGRWGRRNRQGELQPVAPVDKTALHLAIEQIRDERDGVGLPSGAVDASLITLLLEHHADVNAIDADSWPPLHVALLGGLHEVVELLADAGADLSLALHGATVRKDVRMVKLLAARGAPVDGRAMGGWTPLCLAARTGDAEVARALLSARANLHATSANGKTPIEIAVINHEVSKASHCQSSRQPMLELLQTAVVESVLALAFACTSGHHGSTSGTTGTGTGTGSGGASGQEEDVWVDAEVVHEPERQEMRIEVQVAVETSLLPLMAVEVATEVDVS